MKGWHRILIVLSIAAAFCSGGCLHHRLDVPTRKPEPLAENFRREFVARQKIGSSGMPGELKTNSPSCRETTKSYIRHEITLTNVGAAADRSIEFDYYVPHRERTGDGRTAKGLRAPQKIPAVLILPIMGGLHYELESYFARSFAKRGFATAILHRPDIKKEVRELEDIDGLLRKSVQDAQSLLDWLEARPEVDAGRLGLFGISMGAIRGTMVLAVDDRVRAGALGLVGGDVPYILTHTREKGIVRERTRILEEKKLSLSELEEKLRQFITCEPMSVASAVDPSRVLIVIASGDHVIPARKGWELRRKLGNPETLQIFSGHYSSVVYAPWLRWRIGRFFEQKLAGPAADRQQK